MLEIKTRPHGRRCQSQKFKDQSMIQLLVYYSKLNISYIIDLDWLYNQKKDTHILILKNDYNKYKQEIYKDINNQIKNLKISA